MLLLVDVAALHPDRGVQPRRELRAIGERRRLAALLRDRDGLAAWFVVEAGGDLAGLLAGLDRQ